MHRQGWQACKSSIVSGKVLIVYNLSPLIANDSVDEAFDVIKTFLKTKGYFKD